MKRITTHDNSEMVVEPNKLEISRRNQIFFRDEQCGATASKGSGNGAPSAPFLSLRSSQPKKIKGVRVDCLLNSDYATTTVCSLDAAERNPGIGIMVE
jgi:hypothetical protein